jgi:hypothetical protein
MEDFIKPEGSQKNTNLHFNSFNIDQRIYRIDVRENVEVNLKTKPWVQWGNINNDYPQFLLQLKTASPVYSACLSSLVEMSYGDGVEIEGMGNVMVNRFETISELYYKLVYDFWTFGGFSTEAIPTRDKTAFESIYHLPFQNIRIGKKEDDEHESEIDWYYYSEDWGSRVYRNQRIIKMHGINLSRNEGRQLYYWKNYVPSENNYYPLTTYQSGINAIVLEAEIFDFHKRNLAQNLMPSLSIALVGDPTPEEKEEIYQSLIQSYSGKNGHKLMLSFSSSPEERPIIEPINNNGNDSYYTEVLSMAIQSILSSFQVSSPLLLGIHSFSSNPFSQNADEIMVATKHMMEFVVKPKIKKFNQGLENLLSLKYNRPIKIINKFKTPELL